jgi:mannosyltransferase
MIAIDGVVFSLQRAGGISVYFRTLIDLLYREQLATALLLEHPLLQVIEDRDTNIITMRRSSRILERYRACRLPEDISVFHSSYYRSPARYTVPSVLTVYDFIYERYRGGPRRWMHSAQKNAAIRAAQSIICISEATRDDLLKYVGETPGQSIHVIHCAASETFRQVAVAPPPVPFILFVGLRPEYKNFRLALEAMAFLPDLELHCVGGGPLVQSELEGLPESVSRRVKHLGFVTDDELNVLYNGAQCLVYPSSCEGFGIPVLEAMQAGCPVVCTDCKAVLEVGEFALTVVPTIDARLMADAILKTLSSERPSLIQKGLAVAKGYSWDATHRQTLSVYRSLGA